jgi:hypothetical protein
MGGDGCLALVKSCDACLCHGFLCDQPSLGLASGVGSRCAWQKEFSAVILSAKVPEFCVILY